MTPKDRVPTFEKLFNPMLSALRRLGGSASIHELVDAMIAEMRLPESVVAVPHGDGRTEFEYRAAWARNYLKNYGFLENSERGVWALTSLGTTTPTADPKEVMRRSRGGTVKRGWRNLRE